MRGPKRVLLELRHRRVFRTAAFYIVGAWLLLQLADLAFPAFGIPESALRYVFVAAFLGFPLALIFGWMFDITARGIVRTPSITDEALKQADYALKRVDYAVLAILAGVLMIIAYGTMMKVVEVPGSTEARRLADASAELFPERTMIAVLPFANLGPPEDEYFAAGITDEITSKLSGISALGVIASASVQQYAGSNKRPVIIAAELGVDYLLFGTVRWAGGSAGEGRVRVSPKLVRTRDEVQAWSDVYERSLADVFGIQAEIAKTVVSEIGAKLLETELDPIEDIPTENLDAYRAYLRSFSVADVRCDVYRERVRHLNLAVELDPLFAEAWARLADSHATIHTHCLDKTDQRLAELTHALSRSRELAPNSAATLFASARYLMSIEQDYPASLALLDTERTTVEQNANLIDLRGRALRRAGRWDEAIVDFRKGFVLDPRGWRYPMRIASAHMYLRSYRTALEYFDRAIALQSRLPVSHLRKVRTHWLWHGDTAAARRILQNLPPEVPADDEQIEWAWFWQQIYEGRHEEALQRIGRFTPQWIRAAEERWPKTLLVAEAERLRGNKDRSIAAYSESRRLIEAQIEQFPGEAQHHRALAIAYAGLGMNGEAIAEGLKSIALFPLAEERYFGLTDALNQARIYTMVGDHQAAIDMLDTLLSMPSPISVPLLELDPRWKPLRNHPQYRELKDRFGKSEFAAVD